MNIKEIKRFIEAGKSEFTIHNKQTGGRFTFQVKAPDKVDDGVRFVFVMNGPCNESDFIYVGMVKDKVFKLTKKSAVKEDAPSFKAYLWLNRMMYLEEELPAKVEFLPSGKCGRCGRKLTTPESIKVGIGPECLKWV